MKKTSIKKTLMFAFLTLLCAGCGQHPSTSSSDKGYDLPDSIRYTYNDLLSETDTPTLNSVGRQKLLVVPVEFTDYIAHTIDNQHGEKLKAEIDTAFFGEANETGWESVSSFYEKSSYGNLIIEGEVTDWFNLGISSTELRQKEDYAHPTQFVAEQFHEKADPELLQAYDQDQDGDVDAICFIYAIPYDSYGDLFWAYAYWYWGIRDVNNPSPATYIWASYEFMYEGYGEEQIDSHTYIHEVGHMLGLSDYYNYDGASKVTPAGHLDMMDRGVLDHNAYSKMALGWSLPKVVDNRQGETKITLKPFESSGEFILIKNQWNGTPFDEYLLIEFYTPTGLNEKDSSPEGYAGASYIRGFSIPGIKIYHIDARLVRGYRNSSYGWYNYSFVTDIENHILNNVEIGQANTPSRSTDQEHYLVHLLEATNVFSFKNGARAKNDTLFQAGDTFISDQTFFKNGTNFNDFSPIGYQITIDSITNNLAEVTIKSI